jgi:hypothetical protein
MGIRKGSLSERPGKGTYDPAAGRVDVPEAAPDLRRRVLTRLGVLEQRALGFELLVRRMPAADVGLDVGGDLDAVLVEAAHQPLKVGVATADRRAIGTR